LGTVYLEISFLSLYYSDVGQYPIIDHIILMFR